MTAPIIVEKEVKTYTSRALCPIHEKELLKHMAVLTSSPPKYQYSCKEPDCKYTLTSFISYPYTFYREI